MNIFEMFLSLFKKREVVETQEILQEIPPDDETKYRKWRITCYYVANQPSIQGNCVVPIFDNMKKIIAFVEPSFFAQMSLEGTGKLRDGRLLEVSGQYVNVAHNDYKDVLTYHKKYLPKRSYGYSGLSVTSDGLTVKAALAFRVVAQKDIGLGYGIIRGKPLTPFKSLAADIGLKNKHEEKWKGKGGICPPFTKVFIRQFVGLMCPDENGIMFEHDGWFEVIDTGGGIFGCHFDIFIGEKDNHKKVKIPALVDVWYEGIEERVPIGYDYGLVDK